MSKTTKTICKHKYVGITTYSYEQVYKGHGLMTGAIYETKAIPQISVLCEKCGKVKKIND